MARASRFRPGFRYRSPIGLDVGSRWVKAVQLRRQGEGWAIEAAARFRRLEPDAPPSVREAKRAQEVLSRQGFHGHRVVLAAPGEKLMTDLLDLPARTPATPFEQILRAELGRIHKCDPSRLEVAHWDLPVSRGGNPRAARGTQVLAIACRHDDADAVLDVFEQAGLAVVGLDARSVAIARACEPLLGSGGGGGGSAGIGAIVVLEWSSATIMAMYRGVVVYERPVKEASLQRLQENMRNQLNLDEATVEHLLDELGLSDESAPDGSEVMAAARGVMEAHFGMIIQELRASLSYAAHQYPEAAEAAEAGVEGLLLVGEGAGIPALDEYIARRMSLPTRRVTPVELARIPDHLLPLCTPALTAAVGLAQFQE